jgi:hypothetical protein
MKSVVHAVLLKALPAHFGPWFKDHGSFSYD